jgi:RNA polymerase sigma factor (sigma-70 family)
MDMESALALMNEEHRELLTLKFVQGLTNEEIGEITGQKVSAIRAMQFRALKAMRAVLDRKGADQ